VRGRLARWALAATLVALAAPAGASAGLLTEDGGGNLLYAHLLSEDDRSHDIVIEPAGARVRITDADTDIVICPGPPSGCVEPDCEPGATPREAFCDGVAALSVFLGAGNDRLENRTSLALFACGDDGSDRLTGGAEADRLGGGPGRDEVHGGGGADLLAIDLARMLAFDPQDGLFEICEGGAADPFELIDGGPGRDRIEGGPGDDLIGGGADDDSILAFGGDDRADGGAGRDDVAGQEGADALTGGDENDWLFGGPGDDDLSGGAGDDDLGRTLRHDADGLGTGREVALSVELGHDRLDGGPGNDNLVGGPGEAMFDTVDSLAILLAGLIDRRLASPALNGADRLTGGPGEDLVTYVNRDAPVQVTFDGLANDGSAGEGDLVDADVELVWGGARADVLHAAATGSSLFGDLGDDVLVGGPGPDLLNGGFDDGADTISGLSGDDRLLGGPGPDGLDGGPGSDAVIAGGGDDRAAGGPDADGLEGGAGSDELDGGAGADCLQGYVFVSVGQDGCRTGPAVTPAAGADGDDVLHGGTGLDRLSGGGGEDVADYRDARRRVVVVLPGGRGPASAAAALADDVEGARGGDGPDLLVGNGADNALDGGPGDDLVDGGPGVDRLRGGSGRDLVIARDTEPDAVRCGTKRDLALIDDRDEVVGSLADVCEHVHGGGASRGRVLRPGGGCSLAVRLPGAARAVPLRVRAALPAGTVVDARSCPARTGRARVSGGAFALASRGRTLVLRLSGGTKCRGSARRARRLDVRDAPGWLVVRARDFATRGGGASWRTIDGCDGTRLRVRSGLVRVVR
jgi:Ca2+-binding RTX toxin-like protein